MNKVTKLPIGLGMNHLEQEISACHLWNRNIRENLPPDAWVEIQEFAGGDMFLVNRQTGASLENSGFIEIDRKAGLFRLTPKAIDLLKKFTDS